MTNFEYKLNRYLNEGKQEVEKSADLISSTIIRLLKENDSKLFKLIKSALEFNAMDSDTADEMTDQIMRQLLKSKNSKFENVIKDIVIKNIRKSL